MKYLKRIFFCLYQVFAIARSSFSTIGVRMTSKFPLFWCIVIFLILLASCTTTPAESAATETPTDTALVMQIPTQTAISFPTQPPSAPFSIDRLRMVYEKDGNIYLQDGMKVAQKLTFSGTDHDPILSDDGDTILFYRGETNDKVYSIRTDGSGEKLLIDTKILRELSQGEIKGITFIPNSTNILFNTYFCNEPLPGAYDPVECVVGLFLIDTLTGELHRVVTGLSGNRQHDKNFAISPDGKFLSVAASGHVDIYIASAGTYENIKRDAITYLRTLPVEYLATQYWLPDSSGFISVIANSGYYGLLEKPDSFSVYRYTIADEHTVLVPLDPLITGRQEPGLDWAISPDRNWIYYSGRLSNFLGNLTTGITREIDGQVDNIRWSPGSQYFMFLREIYSVVGTEIPVNNVGYLITWLDATHYMYDKIDPSSQEGHHYGIGTIGGESIPLPDTFDFVWSSKFVIFDP